MLFLRKSVVVILTLIFLPPVAVFSAVMHTLYALSDLFAIIANRMYFTDKRLGKSYDQFCKWMQVK